MEAIWAHWGWHDYGMGPGMMWGWGDRMDLYDSSLGTHHPEFDFTHSMAYWTGGTAKG